MSNPTNANLADTFSLKGFVSIGAFIDNTRDETSPLGELSLNSATYATDRAIYSTTSLGANPTPLGLSVFSCRTLDEKYYEAPTQYQQLLLSIIQWCHQQAVVGNFTNNSENVRQALLAEFDGKIIDVIVADMITHEGLWLPASLTFYVKYQALGGTWTPEQEADLERSRVKLWFADANFSSEYDEYEIEFVAPIANDRLDDFFLTAERVQEIVEARSVEELMDLVHQIRNKKPPTRTRSIIFNYVDPLNKNWKLPTNWTFLIYGAAGDNIDAIKGALQEWILDNSTHTREEWAEIFPDIFTSTEVIITPMWSQYAVPNSTLQDGVYSPTVNAINASVVAKRTCTGTAYTDAHIDSVLAVVGCMYKSVALLAVGGPENRDGLDRFEEIWPDYMSVSTGSPDFDRMRPTTQEWVLLLHLLLKTAETMTDFSDLPQSISRVRRQNAAGETMMYAVATFANIQYLVLSRLSMQAYFPPRGVDALRLTVEGAEGVIAMPNAKIGAGTYTTKFVAIGGTAPYNYELVNVSDTNKLAAATLDPDTGDFTATPVAAGDITVKARVTDENGTVVENTFTLHLYTPQP